MLGRWIVATLVVTWGHVVMRRELGEADEVCWMKRRGETDYRREHCMTQRPRYVSYVGCLLCHTETELRVLLCRLSLLFMFLVLMMLYKKIWHLFRNKNKLSPLHGANKKMNRRTIKENWHHETFEKQSSYQWSLFRVNHLCYVCVCAVYILTRTFIFFEYNFLLSGLLKI